MLGQVNKLVGRHRSECDYREIPYVFVGPASRHELGAHAADVYRQRFGGFTRFANSTSPRSTA